MANGHIHIYIYMLYNHDVLSSTTRREREEVTTEKNGEVGNK